MEKTKDDLVNVNSRKSLLEFASELKAFIVKQNLFSDIKGKKYVNVEGWEFAGMATGISPIVVKCKNLSTEKETKYRAEVQLVNNLGMIMGYGVAICSDREMTFDRSTKQQKKKWLDEYAIASMAQTRAIGKAYRNKFAFLMKMAGYEPTPAEEIIVEPIQSANKRTMNKVIAGYQEEIKKANTEPKKRVLLRKMRNSLDMGLIGQKTFEKLKKENGLMEE